MLLPPPRLDLGGGLRPTFGRLSLDEAEGLLQGLYEVNLRQTRAGVPSVDQALRVGSLRYIRRDPSEHWRTKREIWTYGGGDCEDLAAAVAADMTARGEPAIPVVYRVNPSLAHAVVWVKRPRLLIDPSRTGGMSAP